MRDFMKTEDDCRANMYQALINLGRQSYFEDLEDNAIDCHLHAVALHNVMTQTKSKDVCIMANHIKLQMEHERKREL